MLLTLKVRSTVASLLNYSSQYPEALRFLETKYGHPMVINKANTALIAKLPHVRAGDQKALDIYLDLLSTIVSSLIKTGAKHELYSNILMDSGRLNRTATKTVPTEKPVCPRCKENHNVEDCSEFKNMTMTDRIALLKNTGVCFYCLKHITYCT